MGFSSFVFCFLCGVRMGAWLIKGGIEEPDGGDGRGGFSFLLMASPLLYWWPNAL